MESVVQLSAYRRHRSPATPGRPPEAAAEIVILPVVRIVRAAPEAERAQA